MVVVDSSYANAALGAPSTMNMLNKAAAILRVKRPPGES